MQVVSKPLVLIWWQEAHVWTDVCQVVLASAIQATIQDSSVQGAAALLWCMDLSAYSMEDGAAVDRDRVDVVIVVHELKYGIS